MRLPEVRRAVVMRTVVQVGRADKKSSGISVSVSRIDIQRVVVRSHSRMSLPKEIEG